MDSEIHYDRDRPPSYQQALSLSHEGLHKYSARRNQTYFSRRKRYVFNWISNL